MPVHSIRRLAATLGAFLALAAIAVWSLRGKLLYAVLILFGGLVAKTLIAYFAESARRAEQFQSGTESRDRIPD